MGRAATAGLATAVFAVVLAVAGPAKSTVRSNSGAGERVGCFVDQGDPQGLAGRDLDGAASRNNPQMTVQRCLRFCAVMGFRYAGVQYANSCFCGNQYGQFGVSSACDMPCAGDPTRICGGTWANTVFRLNGELGSLFSD
ncbi:MAG: WSC domain-containing protein [Gammaproteobacteria bacterium]|jgi:hypothetical protein|nr:WSC domain-containing protein [Gammaproteobacteria bacterium]